MALPKKVIPNINLVPPKILLERREQLLEDITNDGTYLPKNLDYADLDRGFLDFVKNELKTIVDGKIIPTVDILITTQNWAQFTQTWSFQDLNGNTEPPFITVVRVPEVKYGTNPATLYNIPNQKEFFYAAVPTWNGNIKGLDIYKIPQPVPVDISFNVKIICNRMRELNEFNKNVLQTFASRQAYTKVNGHFIPIINSNISDESVTQIDKRRFYIQNYDFTMLGFILDQDKFEVAPAVSRVLNVFETNFKPINRKRKVFPVNEGVFDLTVQAVRNSPVVRTINVDYTGTFTILSTQNVSSYDLFVSLSNSSEFDFYGTNVINFEVNTGDRLRFEITQQNNDPTSIITYAVSLIGSPQNLTFDLPTPSVTPSNTVTPTNTPTNTPTPSVTPSPTLTPTSSNTPTPTITSSITPTPTSSNTPTPTITSSITPTPTPTITSSITPTPAITSSITPTPTPTNTLPLVTDYDGNTYEQIIIGNRVWLGGNMKTTHYNNGDIIPYRGYLSGNTEPFCSFSGEGAWMYTQLSGNSPDDPNYNQTAGKLYNYFTITDVRGICPVGFRPASSGDWYNLITSLNGGIFPGYNPSNFYPLGGEGAPLALYSGVTQQIKATTPGPPYGWTIFPFEPTPTNSSDFSAYPSGSIRSDEFGNCDPVIAGGDGAWWWTTNYNFLQPTTVNYIACEGAGFGGEAAPPNSALCIRCVRDLV